MEFYYNRHSNESILSQRKKYLQNSEYVNSITSEIANNGRISVDISRIQAREAKKNFENLSNDINNLSSSICDNLEEGFFTLNESILRNNNSLQNISDELNALSNIMLLGFQRLSEEIKITNYILGKIEQLIKVPETQKQRYHFIEEGVKFLKNGFDEGSDSKFYDYAFDEFSKSISQIDNKDYFSLYYLGYLHLNTEKFDNLEKAEMYSSNAGDFFKAEGLIGGTVSAKAMNGAGFSYNQRAIESYLNASRSCYSRNLNEKAIDYCDKCLKLNSKDLTSLFLKSKYLIVCNRSNEAIQILKEIISINKYFPPQILLDNDFCQDKNVQMFLDNLRNDTVKKAKNKIQEIESNLIENSKSKGLLQRVKKLVLVNDYISSIKAMDLLDAELEYNFVQSATKNENGIWNLTLTNFDKKFNALKLVYFENQNLKIQNLLEQFYRKDELLKNKKSDFESQIKKVNSKFVESPNILRAILFSIGGMGVSYWGYKIYEHCEPIEKDRSFNLTVAIIFIVAGIISLLFNTIPYLINSNADTKLSSTKSDMNTSLSKIENELEQIRNEIQNVK